MPNPLDITASELASLPPAVAAQVKAMLNVRQAMFDVFGTYPPKNILPYSYSLERSVAQGNAVGAGLTAQDTIKVSADASFVACQILGASTGDYLCQMRIDNSDRILMNRPVHSSALVGTAERAHYLPKPLLVSANATISFDLTDLSGAQNEIYFTLCGYKIYEPR
jgi:hypothetical protein